MASPQSSPQSEPLDLAAQLADIANRAVILTGAQGAAVALAQGEEIVTVASCGDCAPDVGVPVRRTSFAGRCYEQGTLLVCDDTESDGRADAAACRVLGLRSMVAAPVMNGSLTRGVLAVFAREPHAFMGGRVGLLRTLAAIAGELVTTVEETASGSAPQPPVTEEPAADDGRTVVHILPAFEEEVAAPAPAAAVEPAPAAAPRAPEFPETAATIAPIAVAVEVPPAPPKLTLIPAKEPEPPAAVPVAAEVTPLPSAAAPAPGPAAVAPAPELPAFLSVDHSPRERPRAALVICAVLLVAIVASAGVWRLVSKRAAAAAPAVATQPAAVVPEPAITPATLPLAAAPAPTVTETKPATTATTPARPEEHRAPKPQTMTLRASDPLQKQDTTEIAPPNLAFSAQAPSLGATPRAYVPNAPTSELTPPQLLKQVSPSYPANARRSGAQGAVVLNAQILKTGSIGKVVVVRGDILLRQAAVNAVKQWMYKPASLNGQPTEATVVVEVNFNPGM